MITFAPIMRAKTAITICAGCRASFACLKTRLKSITLMGAHMIDLNDLKRRFQSAQIASCSCRTKTPDIAHHAQHCRYRLFVEAEWVVDQLIKLQDQVEAMALQGLRRRNPVRNQD